MSLAKATIALSDWHPSLQHSSLQRQSPKQKGEDNGNNDNISQDSIKYSYQSNHLPHLFDIGKPIFITFRLKFTLPKPMIKELNLRKENWYKAYQQLSALEQVEASKSKDGLFFAWFDELLANSKQAPQILDREDIQSIIAEAFRYFDEQRYQLVTYCIMPNHVHILINPLLHESGKIYSPAHIVYTWKRYTANYINRVLNRKGSLWHEASYDRMVRDEREFYNTMHYIIKNPVKAHLVDDWKQWKGSYLNQNYVRMLDKP